MGINYKEIVNGEKLGALMRLFSLFALLSLSTLTWSTEFNHQSHTLLEDDEIEFYELPKNFAFTFNKSFSDFRFPMVCFQDGELKRTEASEKPFDIKNEDGEVITIKNKCNNKRPFCTILFVDNYPYTFGDPLVSWRLSPDKKHFKGNKVSFATDGRAKENDVHTIFSLSCTNSDKKGVVNAKIMREVFGDYLDQIFVSDVEY